MVKKKQINAVEILYKKILKNKKKREERYQYKEKEPKRNICIDMREREVKKNSFAIFFNYAQHPQKFNKYFTKTFYFTITKICPGQNDPKQIK